MSPCPHEVQALTGSYHCVAKTESVRQFKQFQTCYVVNLCGLFSYIIAQIIVMIETEKGANKRCTCI